MLGITGDPLNGIVITVTFFISMIIGRYLRKRRGNTIDLRIRILVSFLLIIAATLMNHWYFPVIISISCIAIAIKLRVFGDYIKKIIFPLVLASFIVAVQGLTYGANAIDFGILIFTRVLASASVLVLLMITTSQNDILESMRWFRVPRTLIEISSFMTRYIKTFSHEGKKLKFAQESRCGFSKNLGFKGRMHNTASIAGLLITRAFARSEEVYMAMISRAWKPEMRYSMEIPPLDRSDAVLGIILSSGIIGLVLLDGFL